ncbi:hypothetical protein PPMP20_12375 [Paraburkholderia phymatum]|uniref:Uncharacterized protein n=1 Tax=Paraburkholderia phymatum (strain DSM 17167 / CIP 108236 / LMG 21445 / STM815) TaxID=391038 RepID=B2JFD5_PARP8|nr:hypothetical protein [Paraburkholderia phymatum]ACC71503.1 conserved hypothetical protein [Paraburkholderia phymatum STM815]
MTLRSASPATLDALPNPRGGSVRPAEQAIADALDAFEQRRDMNGQLLVAGRALREAGWIAAQRFTDALLLVSPMASSGLPDEAPARAAFGGALRAFSKALERRNLRELSCSPSLFEHYRALSTHIAEHTPGYSVAFEDIALAGRPIPPVSLRSQSAARLEPLRERFERALLPVLRSRGLVSTGAVAGLVNAALDDLDACLVDLSGPDPYDFWRLALACMRSMRANGHTVEDAETRRFYARCNMALADEQRGIPLAPRSLVRATLALLWRDYALFGAAAEDTEHVELLRDYGLTVDWHIAGTQASEALWEAGAHQAETLAAHVGKSRELGMLTVNANAYEDFLQTADAAISALTDHARAADNPQKADPSAALQAGDAAYRLGAAASALGLGHVALLADALGLAWRRRAHAGVSTPAVRAHVVVDAPDARSLEAAAEALRAMLHKVAAGVAPQSAANVLPALTRAIEQGRA